MNGATAEPCVKTINPPNSARTSRIGANQNFFLTRVNLQSSLRNDMWESSIDKSKLVFQAFWCRARRVTIDPVAGLIVSTPHA